MTYCERWELYGILIGTVPVALGLLITIALARLPRRFWVGAIVGLVVGSVLIPTGRIGGILYWNALRPGAYDVECFKNWPSRP